MPPLDAPLKGPKASEEPRCLGRGGVSEKSLTSSGEDEYQRGASLPPERMHIREEPRCLLRGVSERGDTVGISPGVSFCAGSGTYQPSADLTSGYYRPPPASRPAPTHSFPRTFA